MTFFSNSISPYSSPLSSYDTSVSKKESSDDDLSSLLTKEQWESLSIRPIFQTKVLSPPITETSPITITDSNCCSLRSFIEEIRQRPFQKIHIYDNEELYGYVADVALQEQDKIRFLQVLQRHNELFKHEIDSVKTKENCSGYIKRINLPTNSSLFTRADLHGDVATLSLQVDCLQKDESHYFDEHFHSKENFLTILLGDYVDKGVNDILLMTFILLMRMENPNSFYPVRGNHEHWHMNDFCNIDPEFFAAHKDELTDCYKSFPIAVIVGDQNPHTQSPQKYQYQYAHFSHGLFSPAVDLSSFLISDKTEFFLCKTPSFHERAVSTTPKAQRAFSFLKQTFETISDATNAKSYQWSDTAPSSGPSSRGEGAGYVFSPQDIQAYFQGTALSQAKIGVGFRGHEHLFKEEIVFRKQTSEKGRTKVVQTTLPAAIMSGYFEEQPLQGLLLTVRPKLGDWTKTPITMFKRSPSQVTVAVRYELTQFMYDSFS